MAMSDNIYARLTPIFRDVFDDESLVPLATMTAADVAEWDSLNHIRLMVSIEREFGVTFTTAEVSGFRNVGELVAALADRAAGSRHS